MARAALAAPAWSFPRRAGRGRYPLDALRGRLAGIEMLSYSLGPLGGQVRAEFVADLSSVRTAIVSGGVLCMLGVAATSAWLRGF